VLSFSTCWNSSRHSSGEAVAAEILDLGFRRIELGHGLRAPMVAQLLEARQKMGFAISSVHCFCPLPPEVLADNPDCYEFTSHRPEDRRRATRLAMQTIDMAERFGAEHVVVHAGRIRTMRATEHLRDLAAHGHLLDKTYAREKLEVVLRRERIAETYISRSLDCLMEVADHAAKMNVSLGIENREDMEAVPSEGEMPNFLHRLEASNAGYWHDFGHAQIKENLGLLSHSQWLDTMGSRAIGCHVHDVAWPFSDHRAPFTGEISFGELVPRLPKTCEFAFEMSPRVSREAILTAKARWEALFGP
jgi:sugar phosphate isomerase/epimerase